METFDKLYGMFRVIRENSSWGKRQDFITCLKYIADEAAELRDALQQRDRAGVAEEVGDLAMMSLFLLILVEESTSITPEQVVDNICVKLSQRYPSIFPGVKLEQLSLLSDFTPEQRSKKESKDWYQQKKQNKLIQFCFCSNNKCSAFLRPGTKWLEITSGKKPSVTCLLCHSKADLNCSCLFPLARSDRFAILVAISYLIKGNRLSDSARNGGISRSVLYNVLHALFSDTNQQNALAKALAVRYGLDEVTVLEKLKYALASIDSPI